jgi:hypothetical protein
MALGRIGKDAHKAFIIASSERRHVRQVTVLAS